MNKKFENSISGLKKRYIVYVQDQKIDFENDGKYAKNFADSFGIEYGEPVAKLVVI